MTTIGESVSVKLTYKNLCERRDKILADCLDASSKAPKRGGYNRLIGGYTKTKNDVMNEAIADLKTLNMISQSLHGKDVWSFEEEDVELKGKATS